MRKIGLAMLVAALLAGCAPSEVAAPVYEIIPAEEAAPPAPPPPPAPERVARLRKVPEFVRVGVGDTLIGIAMDYDLDHGEIARWNNLRDPDVIQPGQRLRLTPPPNDPIVRPVPRQPTAVLQPVLPDAVATGSVASSEAPAEEADAVRRETAVVGGQAESPAPAFGDAPYKKTPKAVKYAYSEAMLEKLTSEWRNRQAVAPVPRVPAALPAGVPPVTPTVPPEVPVVPIAPIAPIAPVAPVGEGGEGDAPAAVRERFGVVWGLPARGPLLSGYSQQSKGVDFGGKRGDAVYAAADGEVIYVGTGVKSYGRLVIVRHDSNYLTAYAHNEEVLVKENQKVTRGTRIATMGDSGSDRVMLHFEVRRGGKPIDPAQALPTP